MPEYIGREVAIYELENDAPEQVFYSREDAADCIRYMAAADVEPVKHGRWENAYKNLSSCKCSICNRVFVDETNYCPSCGAKMDLE